MSQPENVYRLTRISDDARVKENGQERVWDGFVTKLYSGTVTFASPHPVESVNQVEMDMRALLERGKLEVIGRAPVFEGIHILHDIEAQEFISQRLGSRPDVDTLSEMMNYRTVIILRYTSGMTTMTEVDYHERLNSLVEFVTKEKE